jgi:hypothetical protein
MGRNHRQDAGESRNPKGAICILGTRSEKLLQNGGESSRLLPHTSSSSLQIRVSSLCKRVESNATSLADCAFAAVNCDESGANGKRATYQCRTPASGEKSSEGERRATMTIFSW